MPQNSASGHLRRYVGVIWIGDAPGERFALTAASLDEARALLEEQYGEGHMYTLYNEDDADRPR